MSSFLNGSGSSGAQSGLGSALSAGSGTAGNDSYAFQLPSGGTAMVPFSSAADGSDIANTVAGGTGTQPLAGLTGVQSGMTMPNFSNAVSGSGDYSFNMPQSGGNLGALAMGGIKAGQQLAASGQAPKTGGTGRVQMQAKDFSAPVVALPMASGSNAGNSLLQMMQRYQPGNVVGTNTGSGYGMR